MLQGCWDAFPGLRALGLRVDSRSDLQPLIVKIVIIVRVIVAVAVAIVIIVMLAVSMSSSKVFPAVDAFCALGGDGAAPIRFSVEGWGIIGLIKGDTGSSDHGSFGPRLGHGLAHSSFPSACPSISSKELRDGSKVTASHCSHNCFRALFILVCLPGLAFDHEFG